jgi:hypothetical protein
LGAIAAVKKSGKEEREQAEQASKAEKISSRQICAHPDCNFLVHSDPSVNESFCCGRCAAACLAEPRQKPDHGKRCEGLVAPEKSQRAKAPSNDIRATLGPDNSYRNWDGADSWRGSKGKGKDSKGGGKSSEKGKGKGKRGKNVDVEAVLGVQKERSPEEEERRKKRMDRFGTTKVEERGDKSEPDAAVADKSTKAVAPEVLASKADAPPDALAAREGVSKKSASPRKFEDKDTSRGLRAWPDDPPHVASKTSESAAASEKKTVEPPPMEPILLDGATADGATATPPT